MEFGGLTDVETGVVLGLVDKLVCSFKLAADVSGVESGSLCMTLTDQHSWKVIWWDCVWIATGRPGFNNRGDETEYIHTVGKGATGFSNVESITFSTLQLAD